MPHNLAAIRELLSAAFGDEDLNNFCADHFRTVYDQFTAGQVRSARVRALVDYADRRRELDRLLAAVKEANPAVYAEFAPRLGAAGAPATDSGAAAPPAPAQKLKILMLSANPASTTPLQLDQEARAIEAKIRAAEYRDAVELITKWAVRPDDLLQSLLQHRPHVVHFSGHGGPEGEIYLLDEQGNRKPASKAALAHLFRTLKDNLRLVVLNACFSRAQAEAITQEIDCVVGMNQAVGDAAAITFAASFYRAIGFGRSVADAFNLGKGALLLEGIPEEGTPELVARQGVDPARVFLVGTGTASPRQAAS
jgi:hypothetical protein